MKTATTAKKQNKNELVANKAANKAANQVKDDVEDGLKKVGEVVTANAANQAAKQAAFQAKLLADMDANRAALGDQIDGARDDIVGQVQSTENHIIEKIDEQTTVLQEEIDSLKQDKAAIVRKAKEYKGDRDEAMRILGRVMDHYDAAKSSGYTSDAVAMFTKAMDIELGAAKELLAPHAKKEAGGIKGVIAGALSKMAK